MVQNYPIVRPPSPPSPVTSDHIQDHPPPSYASLATPLQPSFSSFAPALSHPQQHTGLPSGYFLLRSKEPTRQRTFDVRGRGQVDGTEICLHPVKQPHVPRNASLQNQWNNQIFYLSWDGALMSASADGRAVDCLDGKLQLALPTPIYSIPSRFSHPLPRFVLDPATSVLLVKFPYDPLFPGPSPDPSTANNWLEDDYIVEAMPFKAPPPKEEAPVVEWASGLLSGLERFGSGIFGKTPTSATFPQSPQLPPLPRVIPPWETARSPGSQTIFDINDLTFSSPPIPSTQDSLPLPRLPRDHSLPPLPPPTPTASTSTASPVSNSSPIPIPSTTAVEEEEEDEDSSQDAYRPLRVIRLPHFWREKFPQEILHPPPTSYTEPSSIRLWRRRQWESIPVVVRPVEGPAHELPLPPLPSFPSLSGIKEGGYLPSRGLGAVLGVGRERGRGERPSALELRRESQLPVIPSGMGGLVVDSEDEDEKKGKGTRSESSTAPLTAGSSSWADAQVLPTEEISGLCINLVGDGEKDGEHEETGLEAIKEEVTADAPVEVEGNADVGEKKVDQPTVVPVIVDSQVITLEEKVEPPENESQVEAGGEQGESKDAEVAVPT